MLAIIDTKLSALYVMIILLLFMHGAGYGYDTGTYAYAVLVHADALLYLTSQFLPTCVAVGETCFVCLGSH